MSLPSRQFPAVRNMPIPYSTSVRVWLEFGKGTRGRTGRLHSPHQPLTTLSCCPHATEVLAIPAAIGARIGTRRAHRTQVGHC